TNSPAQPARVAVSCWSLHKCLDGGSTTPSLTSPLASSPGAPPRVLLRAVSLTVRRFWLLPEHDEENDHDERGWRRSPYHLNTGRVYREVVTASSHQPVNT